MTFDSADPFLYRVQTYYRYLEAIHRWRTAIADAIDSDPDKVLRIDDPHRAQAIFELQDAVRSAQTYVDLIAPAEAVKACRDWLAGIFELVPELVGRAPSDEVLRQDRVGQLRDNPSHTENPLKSFRSDLGAG
ncbi:hypothetical protein [Actinocrispum wychmicini]|uniref:Uncharacterized protein n=1 Tax=Actinocrispum wychmicini TaxID=1213861 RepID=A0A4R2IV09_9PSEU|nr:hypothetical protein [Actinocrispum wychmicini]TCO48977.1 hypothetical protein EV192_115198 [Actinocrispum wychmicini]